VGYGGIGCRVWYWGVGYLGGNPMGFGGFGGFGGNTRLCSFYFLFYIYIHFSLYGCTYAYTYTYTYFTSNSIPQ
jgi:hypothetical protein